MKQKSKDTVIQFKDSCDFKMTFPCAQHLWDVNDEAECLDDVKADFFHSLEDKLLYITKRIRPYIERSWGHRNGMTPFSYSMD